MEPNPGELPTVPPSLEADTDLDLLRGCADLWLTLAQSYRFLAAGDAAMLGLPEIELRDRAKQ